MRFNAAALAFPSTPLALWPFLLLLSTSLLRIFVIAKIFLIFLPQIFMIAKILLALLS